MKRLKDPFISGRIEFEHNPVLYMPDDILSWVSREPMLFEGVRGSGKSSILYSLTWEVAWKVSGIKINGSDGVTQLFKNPTHLGVYYRVVEMEVEYWERWKVGSDMAQRYFGTYIDFLYLDLLINALEEIRKVDNTLFSDREAESQFVTEILRQCFPQRVSRPHLAEASFGALRSVVVDAHLGIRGLVFRNASESEITSTYPVVGPGSLLQAFGNLFIKYYPKLSEWTIMALLDDCNYLKKWQVTTINTAVAKAKAPIAYKLTSVEGLYPTRETFHEFGTVIEHDIKTIAVPSARPTDKTYEQMVNGVCKTRIEHYYNKTASENFNLRKSLGPFNIEVLLAEKLKTSENEKAHKLLNLSIKQTKKGRKPSITSTWLSIKKIREDKPIPPGDSQSIRLYRRKIASEYKKKWNHVAAIAICKELRFLFPYCGWKVLLHLSYGSIREMLRIMSMIWTITNLNIDEFVNQSPINRKDQSRAIKKVAETSFEAIDEKPVSPGSTISSICKRLGELFSKCQSYPYISTTAETACIKIKKIEINEEIRAIINKTVTSGILVKEEDKNTILLGLHPVLAPFFDISFRRPFYYPEPLKKSQLEALFLGGDKIAKISEEEILRARLRRYNVRHKKKNSSDSHLKSMKQLKIFDVNGE